MSVNPMFNGVSGLCKNCGTRHATEWFSLKPISGLDMAHGVTGDPWCHRCVLETQLAYAKERAASIPKLEADLAKEEK